MIAFSRCGVPEGRMFIVSPDTGEVKGFNRTFRCTYDQVNEMLHEMFPAVTGLILICFDCMGASAISIVAAAFLSHFRCSHAVLCSTVLHQTVRAAPSSILVRKASPPNMTVQTLWPLRVREKTSLVLAGGGTGLRVLCHPRP